jgi:hypothetical protein
MSDRDVSFLRAECSVTTHPGTRTRRGLAELRAFSGLILRV